MRARARWRRRKRLRRHDAVLLMNLAQYAVCFHFSLKAFLSVSQRLRCVCSPPPRPVVAPLCRAYVYVVTHTRKQKRIRLNDENAPGPVFIVLAFLWRPRHTHSVRRAFRFPPSSKLLRASNVQNVSKRAKRRGRASSVPQCYSQRFTRLVIQTQLYYITEEQTTISPYLHPKPILFSVFTFSSFSSA